MVVLDSLSVRAMHRHRDDGTTTSGNHEPTWSHIGPTLRSRNCQCGTTGSLYFQNLAVVKAHCQALCATGSASVDQRDRRPVADLADSDGNRSLRARPSRTTVSRALRPENKRTQLRTTSTVMAELAEPVAHMRFASATPPSPRSEIVAITLRVM